MFTHPETLCALSDLDAQERLTATAHTGEHSALPMTRSEGRFAPTRLSGMMRRWRSAQRVEMIDPSPRHRFAMQSAGTTSCGFWITARHLA